MIGALSCDCHFVMASHCRLKMSFFASQGLIDFRSHFKGARSCGKPGVFSARKPVKFLLFLITTVIHMRTQFVTYSFVIIFFL